ncbi:MAG: DnaJ domain-containing protein [Vicinamibacterales bacterium]
MGMGGGARVTHGLSWVRGIWTLCRLRIRRRASQPRARRAPAWRREGGDSMRNRRSYYRLLHVQPDAPAAVIKSSHRALMQALKLHPDLGGSHDTAVLLNEACGVLLDPERRAQYDRFLESRGSKTASGRATRRDATSAEASTNASNRTQAPSRSTDRDPARESSRARAGRRQMDPCCAFCGAPHDAVPVAGQRCVRCDSPLTPPTPLNLSGSDRRSVPRFTRGGDVRLKRPCDARVTVATLQDLSPTGMRLVVAAPLTIDDIVRIDDPTLSAVARVVSCRSQRAAGATSAIVGLEFLTLEFAGSRGAFVSQRG